MCGNLYTSDSTIKLLKKRVKLGNKNDFRGFQGRASVPFLWGGGVPAERTLRGAGSQVGRRPVLTVGDVGQAARSHELMWYSSMEACSSAKYFVDLQIWLQLP